MRQQRARSHFGPEDGVTGTLGGGSGGVPTATSPSMLRSFLGVSPFCVAGDENTQFKCVFTPTCWLSGGVPQDGCDSMLYSCCVTPSVARRVSIVSK